MNDRVGYDRDGSVEPLNIYASFPFSPPSLLNQISPSFSTYLVEHVNVRYARIRFSFPTSFCPTIIAFFPRYPRLFHNSICASVVNEIITIDVNRGNNWGSARNDGGNERQGGRRIEINTALAVGSQPEVESSLLLRHLLFSPLGPCRWHGGPPLHLLLHLPVPFLRFARVVEGRGTKTGCRRDGARPWSGGRERRVRVLRPAARLI